MVYSKQFLFAAVHLFVEEGGTNTDPVDRGGLTKFGISSRTYPDLDIENLTRGQALEIYYIDFWLKQSCQAFAFPIAFTLFDSSVNCGPTRAAKWLQVAINTPNQKLKVDGIIGLKTITASLEFSPYKLAGGTMGQRIIHYADLIDQYPEQIKFIKGWNRRAGRLLSYI